jgi:serine/threonine-protein kinase
MPSPERIGRYRILGELGRGAMGIVYRGRDDDLERDVAIKVMTKGGADDSARARFLREARAAARLQHPNIVVIYELGEHEGCPFMVLELLQGIDLQHALEGGIRPDPRLILPLVGQILAGLGHAHEHGIVHRDVKPSNVFLPVGQPAKIMDFGVSRLAGASVTTTSGALSGTPSYMSPEQVSGEEIDGRSDLFSVGLMLYELLTGEKAIQADTVVSVLYKVVHETPKLSLLPDAPEWRRLRAVLERTLARRRADRYPDARAMSADLVLALAELGGATSDWTSPSERLLLHRTTKVASAPTRLTDVPAPPQTSAAAPLAGRPVRTGRPGRLIPVFLAGLAVLAGVGIGVIARRRAVTPTPPAVAPSGPPAPSGLVAGGLGGSVSPPTIAPSTAASPAPPIDASQQPSPQPASASPPAASPAASPGPGSLPSAAPELVVPTSPPPTTVPAASGGDPRLARARDLLRRSRWAEALALARAILDASPTNAEASALAQQAESEIVIEECLRNARSALREGDRERALEEVRRGFLVRKNDPRLLAMHREVVQQ